MGEPQKADRRLDERRGSRGERGRLLVGQRVGLRRVVRDPPAAAEGRRVEPALVVPAGHVRRHEEPLAGSGGEPGPRGRVDPAADPAQEAGGVDGGRLHHPRPGVEGGVAEDRLDDGADLEVLPVERLERAPRAASGATGMK